MKKTIKWPNLKLTTVCKDFDLQTRNANEIIDELIEVVLTDDLLGLAAPQLGYSERILVMKAEDDTLIILINPEIVEQSEEMTYKVESCHSIPGTSAKIKRHKHIKVIGYNKLQEKVTHDMSELQAIILQHELDHLNGITIFQKADVVQKQRMKKDMKKYKRNLKKK